MLINTTNWLYKKYSLVVFLFCKCKGMEITYYGHSCFLVKLQEKSILFDPFISPNPLAKDININLIKPDYILISHGHEDHIADAIFIAKNSGATIISNYEIVNWFEKKGIKKTHPLNHGGKVTFEFGNIKFTNAIHSSMLPDGSYGGNPGGFIIKNSQYCFYYAGDTALTYDMKLLGENYKIDFAFLPIGDNFTMGINDAIICSDFIKCNQIIAMHYDTFEHIKINQNNARKSFFKKQKELHFLNIGQTKKY